jgi:hypothetical protein
MRRYSSNNSMFLRYTIYETDTISAIKIIDTDFIDNYTIGSGVGISSNLGQCVIESYEKRKLPVASNLLKAFMFRGEEMKPHWDIETVIYQNERMNPLYQKYKEEVDRLMVLI